MMNITLPAALFLLIGMLASSALAQSDGLTKSRYERYFSQALRAMDAEDEKRAKNWKYSLSRHSDFVDKPFIYHQPQESSVRFANAAKPKIKEVLGFLKEKSGLSDDQFKDKIGGIVNAQLNRSFELPDIPRCTKYRTGAIPAKRMADETDDFDMIFYDPSDQRQVDYVAKTGAVMIPYVAGKEIELTKKPNSAFSSPRAALAKMLGVRCLPSRITKVELFTHRFIMRQEGFKTEFTPQQKKKMEYIQRRHFARKKAREEKKEKEKKGASAEGGTQ